MQQSLKVNLIDRRKGSQADHNFSKILSPNMDGLRSMLLPS